MNQELNFKTDQGSVGGGLVVEFKAFMPRIKKATFKRGFNYNSNNCTESVTDIDPHISSAILLHILK